MNTIQIQSETIRDHSGLRLRLRSAGMVLIGCSDAGQLNLRPPLGEDWLADLFCAASIFRMALRDAVGRWNAQAEPEVVEALPGVWLVPMPLVMRRRRCGYSVAIVPTEALLGGKGESRKVESRNIPGPASGLGRGEGREDVSPLDFSNFDFAGSEPLAALCQSTHMDATLVRSMLLQLPGGGPARERDIVRLAALVRFVHEDHLRLSGSVEAMESVGKQLAESYEEMNLLYSIIQNMTVQERPERFVAIACQELLGTLPYAWIGVQLADAPAKLKGLSGRLIVAGEPPAVGPEACGLSPEARLKPQASGLTPVPADGGVVANRHSTLREAARALLPLARANESMVLEPASNPRHAQFAALGSMVIAHPITSKSSAADEIVGILIAGEKRGPDTAASSVDTKLLGATASHMAIFLENAALYDDLNAMFLGTLEALTASIDAKDRYTCGHSRRVAHLTQQLAEAIGLDEHTVSRCHIAGLVHDVGKIGVPEAVLLKPGKLNAEEFAWIRRHPEMGHHILKDIPQLGDVLPGVLYHHERWDGQGYPEGLRGEGIPLIARLIGLADSFDAMSSNRTYRTALSREEVLQEIGRCSGAQFDPDLARVFVRLDFSEFDRLVHEHQAREFGAAAVDAVAVSVTAASARRSGRRSEEIRGEAA